MPDHIVEIPFSEYPLLQKLPQKDRDNERIAQLYQAIDETLDFFFSESLDRLDKMRSFWTAYEEDLEAILRSKWGQLYDTVVESADSKRLFLWLANESLYVKNSEFSISLATTRIGYPKAAVTWEPIFHRKSEVYGEKYYTEAEALSLETPNGIDDFIMTSKGYIAFDTELLGSVGVEIADIRAEASKYYSDRTVPVHITAVLLLAAGNTAEKVVRYTADRESGFTSTYINTIPGYLVLLDQNTAEKTTRQTADRESGFTSTYIV